MIPKITIQNGVSGNSEVQIQIGENIWIVAGENSLVITAKNGKFKLIEEPVGERLSPGGELLEFITMDVEIRGLDAG